MPDPKHPHPETLAIHGDRGLHGTAALAPPIFQTSTFRADSADEFARIASEPQNDRFYTRYGNPNHSQVAAVISQLEHAEDALVFPSGMAAITAAVLAFCKSGDHVVAQRSMYAGTQSLLTEVLAPLGIAHSFVDQTKPADFSAAIRESTRLLLLETPSNPLLSITDLRALATLAKARNILTLADNTFATPINQRPLDSGIDIVMHSATKYLGGHSDLSAGILAGRRELTRQIWAVMVKLGYALNGFDSWLLLRGLRTLPLRMARHNSNALAVAQFLQSRNDIDAVYYPGSKTHAQHEVAKSQMDGFGGIVSFELGGGSARVEPFIRSLSLISRAASLGGVESTLVQQSAMWVAGMNEEQMRAAGIASTLLRYSVGIEHPDDLIADLENALNGSLPKERA
jgi:methionine-gamma-lyase